MASVFVTFKYRTWNPRKIIPRSKVWSLNLRTFVHAKLEKSKIQEVKLPRKFHATRYRGLKLSPFISSCLLRLEKSQENRNKVSSIHFLSETGFQRPWAAKWEISKSSRQHPQVFSRFRRLSPLPTVIKSWSDTKLNRGGETRGDKRLFQERSWRF